MKKKIFCEILNVTTRVALFNGQIISFRFQIFSGNNNIINYNQLKKNINNLFHGDVILFQQFFSIVCFLITKLIHFFFEIQFSGFKFRFHYCVMKHADVDSDYKNQIAFRIFFTI